MRTCKYNNSVEGCGCQDRHASLKVKLREAIIELEKEKDTHLKDHGFKEANCMIGGYVGGLMKAIRIITELEETG